MKQRGWLPQHKRVLHWPSRFGLRPSRLGQCSTIHLSTKKRTIYLLLNRTSLFTADTLFQKFIAIKIMGL
jgi:hypothetical protein